MKFLIAPILLLVFCLQFTGFYFYCAFRLIEIQREVRYQLQFLQEEKLEHFAMSHAQFAKAKHGDDELRIRGRMYDIARIEAAGDSLHIFALHDEAEDNLLSFLSTVVSRTTHDKKPLPPSLYSLLTLVYLPCEFSYSEVTVDKLRVRTPYFDFSTEASKILPFQPPKC
jgi:hypothetical protein